MQMLSRIKTNKLLHNVKFNVCYWLFGLAVAVLLYLSAGDIQVLFYAFALLGTVFILFYLVMIGYIFAEENLRTHNPRQMALFLLPLYVILTYLIVLCFLSEGAQIITTVSSGFLWLCVFAAAYLILPGRMDERHVFTAWGFLFLGLGGSVFCLTYLYGLLALTYTVSGVSAAAAAGCFIYGGYRIKKADSRPLQTENLERRFSLYLDRLFRTVPEGDDAVELRQMLYAKLVLAAEETLRKNPASTEYSVYYAALEKVRGEALAVAEEKRGKIRMMTGWREYKLLRLIFLTCVPGILCFFGKTISDPKLGGSDYLLVFFAPVGGIMMCLFLVAFWRIKRRRLYGTGILLACPFFLLYSIICLSQYFADRHNYSPVLNRIVFAAIGCLAAVLEIAAVVLQLYYKKKEKNAG